MKLNQNGVFDIRPRDIVEIFDLLFILKKDINQQRFMDAAATLNQIWNVLEEVKKSNEVVDGERYW